MTQYMQITTKRIESGKYTITREDGEEFYVWKMKSNTGGWGIERQSDCKVVGAPTLTAAKYDIERDDLMTKKEYEQKHSDVWGE